MKRFISFVLMLLLLVTTFLITGCLPPNYSKEKAEKIAKAHQQEAVAWFKENMPEAKPGDKCEAYETGIDLLGAVKGTYTRNNKSYKYVYEYTDKKMYISEGYDEACKIVADSILKDFGYTKEESEISFHGYRFKAKNENDTPKRGHTQEQDQNQEMYSYQEKLLPAKLTPQQFAQAVLEPGTKESFTFYLHLYRDDFPTPSPEKLQQYKNLGSIWCNVKIDLSKQPKGIYQRVYLKDKTEESSYHIEKIQEDLYAGYITSMKQHIKEDKLKVSYTDGKHLTLEIPEGTQPVIFSKKALTLVHYFKNSKGELIENTAEEMFKHKPVDIKGYHQYSTDLFIKDDFSYGYSNIKVSYVKGVYDYKILGLLDLDYWRLKFFN